MVSAGGLSTRRRSASSARRLGDTQSPQLCWRRGGGALERYWDWLKSGPSIVAGDFNANVALGPDGPRFAKVVDQLREMGLVSAWHQHRAEKHGQESRHSHFHMFKPDRPFHIDFAFVPDLPAWRPRSVTLGDHANWVGEVRSDHVPLVIDFP